MHNDFLSFLLANPSIFNPLTLLGLGLAPQIEALVEYLKANWFLPKQAAPYAATVLSVVVQVGICLFYHLPLSVAMIGTIATTAATCWYHELSS